LQSPEKDPEQIAIENNLLQQSDANELVPVVDAVLEKLAAKVAEYRKGKKGLLALFVGEVMKQTKGKADPKMTNDLLLQRLNSKE
jgi:aspartyl-tRNA(Asn)/glutamyl-tRNA(Gln) amidotransferase subunit B